MCLNSVHRYLEIAEATRNPDVFVCMPMTNCQHRAAMGTKGVPIRAAFLHYIYSLSSFLDDVPCLKHPTGVGFGKDRLRCTGVQVPYKGTGGRGTPVTNTTSRKDSKVITVRKFGRPAQVNKVAHAVCGPRRCGRPWSQWPWCPPRYMPGTWGAEICSTWVSKTSSEP